MHLRTLMSIVLLLVPAVAEAQIPEKLDNLQVFPRDIPVPALVQRMREFSFALGVRCEYCHDQAEPGGPINYASDARRPKQQARAMLRMVAALNDTLLAQLPSRAEPRVTVGCATCHRGLPLPKTLQTTLYEVAIEKGGAAAVERYRELRQQEMGTGRYNFREWEINELARRLAESQHPDAAIAVLEMNGEFYPKSASIDYMLGELHRGRGEREQARARYRAAIAKEPAHEGAKRRLAELEAKPPNDAARPPGI